MKEDQIVFSNYPYHKFTLKYTLDSLARLGARRMEFVACEPHFYVDDIVGNEVSVLKNLLRDRGIEVVCLTAPCNEYSINLAAMNPIARKRSIDYIVRHIEFADQLGVPAVQFVAGEAMLQEACGEVVKRAMDSLAYLKDIARGYGVKLLNSYSDSKFSNVFGSAREVRNVQRMIDPEAFAGLTDTVYMSRCGESAADVMDVFSEDLYMVELADCGTSDLHLAPGEGKLNLDRIIAEFDDAGYTGYYALNMRGLRTPYLYEEEPERCMGVGARYLYGKLRTA